MEIQQPYNLDPSEYVSSLNGLTGDVVLAAGSNITLTPVGNTITIASTGGGGLEESFETVSKNLKGYDYVVNYTGDSISSIDYTVPSGIITKTFNYTGDQLDSIVLSEETPSGISLTKTFSYVGGNVDSVSYS